MKKNQYVTDKARQQQMIQVLTKLEQTSDERNQETSNLQRKIYRLVLWICKKLSSKLLKVHNLCTSVDSQETSAPLLFSALRHMVLSLTYMQDIVM